MLVGSYILICLFNLCPQQLNQGKRFPGELKPMYDEATEKMRKSLSKLKWLFKCLTDQVLTFLEVHKFLSHLNSMQLRLINTLVRFSF